jgi:lipopolysaccharide/colanic/teichoic acid biosynthesis glycosyltransferase
VNRVSDDPNVYQRKIRASARKRAIRHAARWSTGGATRPREALLRRDAVGGSPERSEWTGVSSAVMRALDVGIAVLALIALSPLMLLIALLIPLTSRGPILFRQTRVGHLGQPFVMLKFRSMLVDCDDRLHRDFVTRMLTAQDRAPSALDGRFKLSHDPRITRIGSLLRRTSLDELPQLFNVLRGEMSLIGPRPALPWEVELYQEHHRLRFSVRPGMTGLWQVRGRNLVSMEQALDLDVTYVHHRTLRLNLWILLMTLPTILRGDGAR